MGTMRDAHKMVEYTLAKFWGLARMQEDDAHMISKTPAKDKSRLRGEKQLAYPPFLMGTDIWHAAHTSAHYSQNRELKQNVTAGKAKRTKDYPQRSIQQGVRSAEQGSPSKTHWLGPTRTSGSMGLWDHAKPWPQKQFQGGRLK